MEKQCMKTNGISSRVLAIAMVSIFGLVAATVQAGGNLYWSGDGSTLGGSGTWDTSTGQWSSSGSAPFSAIWNNSNHDIAVFAGTAGTVTNTGVTVGGLTFSAAGYTITGGTLTFGTAGIITNAGAATISSVIAGSATITKNGAGALNFRVASNTYTGDTIINGGTLFIGASANGGSSVSGRLGNGNYAGNIYIATNALLSFRSNENQTWSGIISGDGNLFVGGGGTLTLSGANTYTGTTQIAPTSNGVGGFIRISSFNSVFTDLTLGTVHSASSSLGAPTSVANGTITLGQAMSGIVTLTYTGPGETTDRTLNFANINNGARYITLDNSGSGLLKFTTTPTGVTLDCSIVLQGTSNGELVGGLPFPFPNLTKSGNGTWTLGGRVGNTGSTTISGGTLIGVVGGSSSNSTVTVNNTTGCILGIAVNDNNKKWTCASLISGGTAAKLAFGFTTSPSTSLAPLNVTGTLTFTGVPSVTIDPANMTSGTYPLLICGGTAPGGTPAITIGRGLTGTTAWNGNTLEVTVSGASTLPLRWVLSSGTWNIGTTANWKDNTGATTNYLDGVITGDPVVFDDTYVGGNATVTLNTTVKPFSVIAANSTCNYTLSGSGKITGPTGLTKSGSGNFTLATTNTYTGATTINAGTLTGETGGSCNLSDVTVNSNGALGVQVTDSAKQWSCKSVTVSSSTGTLLKFAFSVAPSSNLAPLKVNGDLTFTGTPMVDVSSANLVMDTTYPLLVVGGTAPTGIVPTLTGGVGGNLFWQGNTLYLTPHASGTVIRFR
jgi:fibronectin-binding autotransporter adhesin